MHRLVAIAGAVVLAVTGLAAPGAAAPPGAAPRAVRPEPARPPVTVTLITGDRVRLTESGGRQNATVLSEPGRPAGNALIRRRNGHLFVIPAQATRLLAAGKLDQRLFDVTELAAQRHSDAGRSSLPVILAADAGPLDVGGAPARRAAPAAPAVPAGSTGKRRLPRLSATAVNVAEPAARTFWSAVTEAPASGDAPEALAGGVGTIWFDGRVKATLDRSVPQIGAPAAYARGLDGKGVKVAVLDCGIDDQNADVAPKVTAQADFVNEGDTDDHCGHGTHVASIVAGSGANSGGKYRGVATGATLLDGKVLDASGFGEESGVLAGMQWAVEQGADIVNLSLGSGPTDGQDPASLAINQLSAASGTLFVVAAGNDGSDDAVSSPASADAALAVGAVDRQDVLAGFSSRGPRLGDGAIKPEITAPGVDIVAAQAGGTQLGDVVAPGYIALSGTSMATPHVAGAAALLAQQHPDWSGARLKAGLVTTADPNADEPVWWQGNGRVDLAAATGSTLRADRGTIDFGFFDWPHGGDPAVGRTLTLTNDGTAPVSLDLAASLRDDGGRVLPASGLTLSPSALTLAPGRSGTVTLTVQPDDAGVGRWGGYLTASAGGTVLVRTAIGLVKESERYPLHVHVLDRSGRPATDPAFVDVINPDTGDWLTPIGDDMGPDQEFRVPPGTWHVAATIVGDTDATQVIEPAVEVKAETSVTLSGKGAREVVTTVRAPRTETELVQIGYGWSEAFLASGIAGGDGARLYAKATAKAPRDDFQWFQSATRREPAVEAVLAGQPAFGLDVVPADDRLDGRRAVALVGAPAAGRKVVPSGAYVLLEVADPETPANDTVAAAKAAGAGGVVLWSRDPVLKPWLQGLGPIPALRASAAEGAQLAKLVRSGPRPVALTGRVWSRPVFDLVRTSAGRVPADLTVRYRQDQLAPVTNRFRSLGGFAQGDHLRFGDQIGGGWAVGIPAKLGSERTDYLTPGRWGEELDVYRTPVTGDDWPVVDFWFGDFYQARAGRARQDTWLDALLRPGDSAKGAPSFITYEGQLAGYLAPFPDASGHAYGGGDSDGATWTLRRGSTVVATGEHYVEVGLPAGSRRFTLTHDVKKSGARWWQRSTAAHTVLGFTVPADPAPSEDPEVFPYAVVPTLRVDAKLPLDLANTARAGSTLTFEASGGLPNDAEGKPVPVTVSQLSFATSADGGKHWTPATVSRVDRDTFRVTIRNGAKAGPVAVRLSASARNGSTIQQEVQAAYVLR